MASCLVAAARHQVVNSATTAFLAERGIRAEVRAIPAGEESYAAGLETPASEETYHLAAPGSGSVAWTSHYCFLE